MKTSVLPLLTVACSSAAYVLEYEPGINAYDDGCEVEHMFAQEDTPLFGGPSWLDLTAPLATTADLVVDTVIQRSDAGLLGSPLTLAATLTIDWSAVQYLDGHRAVVETDHCIGFTAGTAVPGTLTSPDLGTSLPDTLGVILPGAPGAPRWILGTFDFDPLGVDPAWLATYVPDTDAAQLTSVRVVVELKDDEPLRGAVVALELSNIPMKSEGSFSADPVVWPTP